MTVRSSAERREAVTELATEGLSNRAIADVLGINDRTVRRDLAGPLDAANAAQGKRRQGEEDDYAAANAAEVRLLAILRRLNDFVVKLLREERK